MILNTLARKLELSCTRSLYRSFFASEQLRQEITRVSSQDQGGWYPT